MEEKYGSKKLLWVIVITVLVTGIINCILFPNVVLCGASGVAFTFIQDSISNLSHVVGGIIGSVVGYMLNKKHRWYFGDSYSAGVFFCL